GGPPHAWHRVTAEGRPGRRATTGAGRPLAGGPGLRAVVNGEPLDLAAGTTVADVVALVCTSDRGVAVAVDREVVPRSAWDSAVVPDGARVEVVTAAAGG
ncbi:MAG: sulfur carrier protein ThiS, partial [Acidimicrobiales bacterium]